MQGVVKALREQDLLPRVIAGSSVGSIGARARCTPFLQPACTPSCVEGSVAKGMGAPCAAVLAWELRAADLLQSGKQSGIGTLKDSHCGAVAACVGTRNEEEMRELFDNAERFDLSFFSNNTAAEFLKHFLRTGTLQDSQVLQRRLERLLGNATFLQAFQHSGAPCCRVPYEATGLSCVACTPMVRSF